MGQHLVSARRSGVAPSATRGAEFHTDEKGGDPPQHISCIRGECDAYLVLFLNGLLCVALDGVVESDDCAIRISMDYVAILAMSGNAVMSVYLAILPVSLKQLTHLDIPTPQLVAFCFHGLLLLDGLALSVRTKLSAQ